MASVPFSTLWRQFGERVRKKEEKKATTRRTRAQKSEVTWATTRTDRTSEGRDSKNLKCPLESWKKGEKGGNKYGGALLPFSPFEPKSPSSSSSKCPIPSRKTMEFNLSPLRLRPSAVALPQLVHSPCLSLSSLRRKFQNVA